MLEIRNAYKILVEKPRGKRPLGISKRRREENIRMDLGETRLEYLDWMHLTTDRDQWLVLVKAVENLQVT